MNASDPRRCSNTSSDVTRVLRCTPSPWQIVETAKKMLGSIQGGAPGPWLSGFLTPMNAVYKYIYVGSKPAYSWGASPCILSMKCRK